MRAVAPLLFLASSALADSHVTGDMSVYAAIEAGIVCAAEASSREAAPDTRTGFIDLVEGEITLGLATARVPALPGLAFGVVAQVADNGEVRGATIIVIHPPIGAEGTVRESWRSDLVPGNRTANFFRFDYPEEQAPGPWTLQAELDGKVLYTARFEVVDPALMADFVNPCEMPPQLS